MKDLISPRSFVYLALVCLTFYSEDLVALKQWIRCVKCSSWPSEGVTNKTTTKKDFMTTADRPYRPYSRNVIISYYVLDWGQGECS